MKVSTSSAVTEGKEVLFSASSDTSVRWDPLGSSGTRPVTVHFVLEESSGYMEPTLRILAILHTVISFFCIIGYYCLKVRDGASQPLQDPDFTSNQNYLLHESKLKLVYLLMVSKRLLKFDSFMLAAYNNSPKTHCV